MKINSFTYSAAWLGFNASEYNLMRIFVIGARGFPGVQGGIERHCEELYSRLANYEDLSITVIAIDRYRSASDKSPIGITYKYVKSLQSKNLEKLYYGIKASLYTLFKRPDIVHFQGLSCAIFIPLVKLFGIKVIFTQHSRDYLYPKWSRLAQFFLKLSEIAALRADGIIAVSDSINNYFKEHTNKSIVIHNGVNIKHLKMSEAEEEALLNKYGLKKNNYIFFAGRLTEEKSIEDLIDAYCGLENAHFKLVIAGDADHEDNYSRMIKERAKKSGNIILTGFITGKELQALFSNAKLFVLPSKYEGLPIALLEALSYGIEVLASDIEANLNIALNGNNYFRQGDVNALIEKMRYFLNALPDDKENSRRLNMLEEQYNWDVIAGKTYELYRGALLQ